MRFGGKDQYRNLNNQVRRQMAGDLKAVIFEMKTELRKDERKRMKRGIGAIENFATYCCDLVTEPKKMRKR